MQTPNKVNESEFELIKALRAIVAETMAFPPCRPTDSDSYLPPDLIDKAQKALALYGLDIERNHAMVASGVSA